MSEHNAASLKDRLHDLAELIVSARPGRIRFDSEEQFLSMLSLQPADYAGHKSVNAFS